MIFYRDKKPSVGNVRIRTMFAWFPTKLDEHENRDGKVPSKQKWCWLECYEEHSEFREVHADDYYWAGWCVTKRLERGSEKL